MAKVLLGISIALLIGAAVLGFMTKTKVEQKVAQLTDTKAKLATTEGTLNTTKKSLEKTEASLTEAKATIEDDKGKLTEMQGKVTTAEEAATTAKAAVTEAETKLAAVTKERDDMKNSLPPVEGGGDIKAQLTKMQDDLTKATAELAEAKVMRDQFQQRQKASDEQRVALETRINQLEAPAKRRGLTGRVLNVNQGWNFVVIDVGDKQGVTVNSPLLVVRGGQRIASLKITSVEPRTAIADVVPGTMARGDFVMPGDQVVFAGERGAPAAAPIPPAGAAAGAAPVAGTP